MYRRRTQEAAVDRRRAVVSVAGRPISSVVVVPGGV
jgi:hypothetical protein